MATKEQDRGPAQDGRRQSESGVSRIPIQYEGLDKLGEHDPGPHRMRTPASIARDERQKEAFGLVKRVLVDEVANQMHFVGAKFSAEDRTAILAAVRRQVGASGPAAIKLDGLTERVILSMQQGDRAGAIRTAASRTSDELVSVANAIGESVTWRPPTRDESGEPGPAELAAEISRR